MNPTELLRALLEHPRRFQFGRPAAGAAYSRPSNPLAGHHIRIIGPNNAFPALTMSVPNRSLSLFPALLTPPSRFSCHWGYGGIAPPTQATAPPFQPFPPSTSCGSDLSTLKIARRALKANSSGLYARLEPKSSASTGSAKTPVTWFFDLDTGFFGSVTAFSTLDTRFLSLVTVFDQSRHKRQV